MEVVTNGTTASVNLEFTFIPELYDYLREIPEDSAVYYILLIPSLIPAFIFFIVIIEIGLEFFINN